MDEDEQREVLGDLLYNAVVWVESACRKQGIDAIEFGGEDAKEVRVYGELETSGHTLQAALAQIVKARASQATEKPSP